MRFTVTAHGSAGDKPVSAVVGSIARYLLPPDQRSESLASPGAEAVGNGQASVGRYYADTGDSPGRWMGQGARELALAGTVDFDDFTSVLAGRDPGTGERLITARGSAGRVASLGAGSVARRSAGGEAPTSKTTVRPTLMSAADIEPVNRWIRECEVAWIECQSAKEAEALEKALHAEWIPPLSRR